MHGAEGGWGLAPGLGAYVGNDSWDIRGAKSENGRSLMGHWGRWEVGAWSWECVNASVLP